MWGSTDDNFAVKTPQLRTEGRPHRKVTVTVLIAILGKACFQGWPSIGPGALAFPSQGEARDLPRSLAQATGKAGSCCPEPAVRRVPAAATMGLELYLDMLSQPCRAVSIFAKKNGIPFKLCTTEVFKGQHLSKEFFQINSLRRVPTLKDGDFILAERCFLSLSPQPTWPLAVLLCALLDPMWQPPLLDPRASVPPD
ncbi:uncharacterized protein LOC123795625 isoform X4 [Ursus americanus]|uniref:uncharacterized protein LOC123795625 isoform X4 n=1 Tax=Ursus americanus TaxID=9643 RepID=UPI001E679485|nr:uncharacterized protein LOC123795625 isoform X4 [Ursus americanus]